MSVSQPPLTVGYLLLWPPTLTDLLALVYFKEFMQYWIQLGAKERDVMIMQQLQTAVVAHAAASEMLDRSVAVPAAPLLLDADNLSALDDEIQAMSNVARALLTGAGTSTSTSMSAIAVTNDAIYGPEGSSSSHGESTISPTVGRDTPSTGAPSTDSITRPEESSCSQGESAISPTLPTTDDAQS